jgi:hypothetical protein
MDREVLGMVLSQRVGYRQENPTFWLFRSGKSNFEDNFPKTCHLTMKIKAVEELGISIEVKFYLEITFWHPVIQKSNIGMHYCIN